MTKRKTRDNKPPYMKLNFKKSLKKVAMHCPL